MSPSKRGGVNLRMSSATDDQMAQAMRHVAPWFAWAVGMPLAATSLYFLHAAGKNMIVPVILGAGTLLSTWFLWRVSASRSRFGRGQHIFTMVCAMSWIWWVATFGWSVNALEIWATGGFIGCLCWNIRYAHHPRGPERLLEDEGKAPKRKKIDMHAAARMLGNSQPKFRAALERMAPVIPAAGAPWRQPLAIEAGDGPAVDAGPKIDVEAVCRRFDANWDNFRRRHPEVKNVKVKFTSKKPWMITGELIGIPGDDTAEKLIEKRAELASQSRTSLNNIRLRIHPLDHSRAIVDIVLKDMLARTPAWVPPKVGVSVADGPVLMGVRQDASVVGFMQVPTFKKDGSLDADLAHCAIEGMTGSGKSMFARIIIAHDVACYDVENWAIDAAKGVQTLGPVASALEWLVTDIKGAQAMTRFAANKVVQARANYLARKGLDGWEPGCGLPFLRILIEEAAKVANELGDLVNLLNQARSAGVALILSFQRAHHGMIDTNARGAFGLTVNLGCKRFEDAFLLEDEMAEAGADPSQWKNRQKGKFYIAAEGLTVEQMVMEARTYQIDKKLMEAFVAEHGEAKRERMRKQFPDWYALLDDIDVAGTWARHKTGMDVKEELFGTPLPNSSGTPSPAAPVTPFPDDPENIQDAEVLEDENSDGSDADILPFRSHERSSEMPSPSEDETDPDEAGFELDLEAEVEELLMNGDSGISRDDLQHLKNVAADKHLDEIDPDEPIVAHPGDTLVFDRSDDDSAPREVAVAYVVQLLAHCFGKSPGFEFTASWLYQKAEVKVGKSAGWYRTLVSGYLLDKGFIERIDEVGGVYRPLRAIVDQFEADTREASASRA